MRAEFGVEEPVNRNVSGQLDRMLEEAAARLENQIRACAKDGVLLALACCEEVSAMNVVKETVDQLGIRIVGGRVDRAEVIDFRLQVRSRRIHRRAFPWVGREEVRSEQRI